MLMIVNTSDHPITIGPENVVASAAGQPLAVITSEQLEREARRHAFWIQFGAAMQAASNSMAAANAGNRTTTGTYSGTASAYGSGGSAYGTYSGTYTGTQYDAAAAAQARANANAQNAVIADNANARAQQVLGSSQNGALQRQTLAPGQEWFTPVTVDRLPRNPGEVVLTLQVGEDSHEFRWNYAQQ
jgi:hypothetical protein